MKYSQEVQQRFEEFNKVYFHKEPLALYQPIHYAMESGGKYIRPLLLIYAAELFGTSPDKVMSNAYGIELFHNFTLLHDDIMDNSSIRRGLPTVFKKYGLNAGILSGDLMFVLSLQLASKLNGKTNGEVFDLLSETSVKILEGQQMDVDFESLSLVEEKEYLRMIEYKTAVLLACSLQMGALMAGASYVDQKRLYEFGRLLGIAFQIQDDYLDAFGDAQVGKRIGGDILNNKKTLLFIASMRLGKAAQQETLLKYFKNKKGDEEEKIAAVKEIFVSSGGKDYCMKLMKSLHADALKSLQDVNTKQSKDALLALADMLIQRNH